jgi:chitodextrinase
MIMEKQPIQYHYPDRSSSVATARDSRQLQGVKFHSLGEKGFSILLPLLCLLLSLGSADLQAATLTVELPGSGNGSVNSSPAGITCPGDCTGDFTSVTLLANANGDSIFSGWGGACAGMEVCSLTLSGASTVTALFTLKSSPVQVSGSHYGALQKGCDEVAAGGTVMAESLDQPGNLTLTRGVSLTLRGGYDSGFSSNTGNITEVNGTVSLNTGAMTMENIAIGSSVPSPTTAPDKLLATAGNGQVSISWDPVATATSYNVYYSTTTGVTRANGTKVPGTSSPSLTVTGLANGTTYYFVVTAVSPGGESVESNQLIIAPVQAAPAAPTNVLAVSGNASATVSWTPVSGASSYNIYYSTSQSVSKTNGTKITGASNPRTVTGLSNNTPYWFVVTAVNTGGESADSSPAVFAVPTAPASGFSLSDLTGNWYFIRFAAGPDVTSGDEPAWMRGIATVAANGSVTVTNFSDSLGGTTGPPAGGLSMTIDSTGVVTQSGFYALDSGNHAVMASDKYLVVGNGSSGNSRVMMVFVKQGVTTFSNTDLASKTFTFHQLNSGDYNEWAYGTGSVNGSRQVTLNSITTPFGSETPVSGFTISLSTAGIMTDSSSPTSQGVMTPDRRNVFVTETQSDSEGTWHTFRVIQMTGQTFSLSDMAGVLRSHALVSSPTNPYWEYETLYINSSGSVFNINDTDSNGNTSYSDGMGTLILSPTGVMTSNEPGSDFHGQVSFNKDMAVMTETWDPGEYALTIVLKQQ